jgi:hypothetical protein
MARHLEHITHVVSAVMASSGALVNALASLTRLVAGVQSSR